MFDDQHNQIGLINLQVIVLYFNRVQDVTWTKASDDPMINTISKTLEAQEKTQDIKQSPSTKIGTKSDVRSRRNELTEVTDAGQLIEVTGRWTGR